MLAKPSVVTCAEAMRQGIRVEREGAAEMEMDSEGLDAIRNERGGDANDDNG